MSSLVKALAFSVLAMLLAGCAHSPQTPAGQGPAADQGVKGQVLVENKGAAQGVYVYAYDSGFNDLRVPTKYISKATPGDGTYSLSLPPGTWWIVARRRESGNPKGYLVKGDYEGKYPNNPVVVKPGEYTPVNMSIAQLSGNFLLAPYLPTEGNLGISGRVTDESGNPAAGAYVLLYKDREMVGLPTYLSKPTNQNGEYTVFLAKPGTYYVAARIKYGGLPKKGEPYGTYDKDAEHKVIVGEKEIISGVDVKLGPFPLDLVKPVPSVPQQ